MKGWKGIIIKKKSQTPLASLELFDGVTQKSLCELTFQWYLY